MHICGLNKLTLLDFPKLTACVIFTRGCNFRCPYCHNRSLIVPEEYPEEIPPDTVFSFLEKRKGVLEGVVISGGEPTLQNDLFEFIERVKSLGYKVKLDTNGTKPDVIKRLLDASLLDYIAMDVKNSIALYSTTSGAKLDVGNIIESAELIKTSNIDYEFRTTVVKGYHTENTIADICTFLDGAKRLVLQKYKSVENPISGDCQACSDTEMDLFKAICRPHFKEVAVR